MGITGLLPLLSSITKSVHVHELQGLTIAIDAYSWLHRGMYGSCAIDRFNGINNLSFVPYCMSRIQFLQRWNIKPIMVFDGANLPIKEVQEGERASNREKAKLGIKRKMEDGLPYNNEIQRQVDVTPELASKLIKELIFHKIPYVVAPYEADAQLAYLDRTGKVDAIITEDSDLLVFGCRRVLFKFDYNSGMAKEIRCKERFHECTSIDLSSFSFRQFRQLCILSGCDYLENVPGLGLKTAHRLLLGNSGCIKETLKEMRRSFSTKMPASYEDSFRKAEMTFEHQMVYDQDQGRMVHLRPLEYSTTEDLDYLGSLKSDSLSFQIARGIVCPTTGKVFDVESYSKREEDFIPISPIKTSAITMQDRKRITLPARLSMSTLTARKTAYNGVGILNSKTNLKISKQSTQRSIRDFFIRKQ